MTRFHEIIKLKKRDDILDRIDRDLFLLKIVLFTAMLLVLLLLVSV